jgi:hypothetical protein
VPATRTEIDQCIFGTSRVPRIHIGDTQLKFERCRNAVGGLNRVILRILTVLVQVDESRRYDKSDGI